MDSTNPTSKVPTRRRTLVKGTKSSKKAPKSNELALVLPNPQPLRPRTYPLDKTPTFPDIKMQKRYENLSTRELVQTKFMDVDGLSELGILPQIRDLFERVGCEFVLNPMLGLFPELMLEFLSSLDTLWEAEIDEAGVVNRKTKVVRDMTKKGKEKVGEASKYREIPDIEILDDE